MHRFLLLLLGNDPETQRRLHHDQAAKFYFASPFPDPPHTGPFLDSLPFVSPPKVSNILSGLPCKSSNMDFIPTLIIKSCHSVFSLLIARLVNLSFSSATFLLNSPLTKSDRFKKTGIDKGDPSNYRPLSNLNNISKILKRLFLNRIRSLVIPFPN